MRPQSKASLAPSEFLTELCNLRNKTIVLASRSPRRKRLLESVGLHFRVVPAQVSEAQPAAVEASTYARNLARRKAHWVADRTQADLIIGADTIVVVGENVLEKPDNGEQARAMLRTLSGRWHQVITGLCLLTPEKEIVDSVTTRVRFANLTDQEIEAYLRSGEPLDKAGAYGIQGLAALFIPEIQGCYYNVVGFPLPRFYQHLKTLWHPIRTSRKH